MGQITVKVERTANTSVSSTGTQNGQITVSSAELANVASRMAGTSSVKVYDGYAASVTLSMIAPSYITFTRMPVVAN